MKVSHLIFPALVLTLAVVGFAQSRPTRMGVNGSSSSASGSFVDTTSTQTVGGAKTFTSPITTSGATPNLFLNEGSTAANTYISMNGSTVSRYLQFTTATNTWNFAGGTPVVQVLSRAVVLSPGTTHFTIQAARTAATAGSLAVVFSPAFGATPACTCTGESANVCSISVAPTTAGVTFLSGAGTAVIDWICVGTR